MRAVNEGDTEVCRKRKTHPVLQKTGLIVLIGLVPAGLSLRTNDTGSRSDDSYGGVPEHEKRLPAGELACAKNGNAAGGEENVGFTEQCWITMHSMTDGFTGGSDRSIVTALTDGRR